MKVDPKADLLADLLPDSTDKHGQHLFDASCKICTGKLVPNTDTTPTKVYIASNQSVLINPLLNTIRKLNQSFEREKWQV